MKKIAKVVKKKTKKTVKEEVPYLSEAEMLKIELHNERVRNLEQSIKIKNYEIEVSRLMVERNIINMLKELEIVKLKRTKFNEEIRNKFNIESEKFGYDPISGELKLWVKNF